MNFIKCYAFKGIRFQNKWIAFGMRRETVHKHLGPPTKPRQGVFPLLEYYGPVALAYHNDRLWYISVTSEMPIQFGFIKLEPSTKLMEILLTFKMFYSPVPIHDYVSLAIVPDLGLTINYEHPKRIVYALYDRRAYDEIVVPADENCAELERIVKKFGDIKKSASFFHEKDADE